MWDDLWSASPYSGTASFPSSIGTGSLTSSLEVLIRTEKDYQKVYGLYKERNVQFFSFAFKDDRLKRTGRTNTQTQDASEVVDRIILNRLSDVGDRLRIIPDNQFGFRRNHATIHQLSRVVYHISGNMPKRKITAMVLLDSEKAFDTVWIEGLIQRLGTYSFPSPLIKLVSSYLTDREIKVRVGNKLSAPLQLAAGLPQGSVMSPWLFNIYTSHLLKLQNSHVHIAGFADDLALYSTSVSAKNAINRVRNATHHVIKEPSLWKINSNAAKSEAILFTPSLFILDTPFLVFGHSPKKLPAVIAYSSLLDAVQNISDVASLPSPAIMANRKAAASAETSPATPQVPVSNSFELLANSPEIVPDAPKKEFVPPIVLNDKPANITQFITDTRKVTEHDIRVRSNGRNTKIIVASRKDYQKVYDLYKERNVQFFSFAFKNDHLKRFVLHDLPETFTPEVILAELKRAIPSITSVSQMTKKLENGSTRKLPLFILTAKKDVTIQSFSQVRAIFYHEYKVETFRSGGSNVVQCYKCQNFGHTNRFCNMPERCVRCGQAHSAKECKETILKCPNCSENHSAGSLNCKVRHPYIQRNVSRKSPKKVERVPAATVPPITINKRAPAKKVTEGLSFSEVLGGTDKSTRPAQVNSPTAPSVGGHSSAMSDFIKDMQIINRELQGLNILQMTHLKLHTKLYTPGYITVRNDRVGRNGGGVAILLKESIPLRQINLPVDPDVLKECLLRNLFDYGGTVIVAGDFNARHRLWHCIRKNPNGAILYDLAYNSKNITCKNSFHVTQVVRTLRCGRNNPGSNPGHGTRVNYIVTVYSRYSLLDLRPLSEEVAGRDRLVVRTLRCGRNNPVSNPGHGTRVNFIVTVHSRYSLLDLRPLSEEVAGRDRLVVRTLRCGRNNPGSNPGHGTRVNFIVTVHSRYSLLDLRPLSEEVAGRDRLVVRTLRCGRNNPGSNPGHGTRVNFIVTVHSRYSLLDLRPLSEEVAGRDRLVVRTLRCGRNNPGSNPGHGTRVNFNVTVHSRYSLPDLRPLSEEVAGRDRLVVRTLRCGRNNPGSNPGHGTRVNFIVTVHSRYSLPDLRPLSEEVAGRDRLVVRTLRCGRNNPGSNPGHGTRVNFIFSVHSRYSRLDLRPLSEEVAGLGHCVVAAITQVRILVTALGYSLPDLRPLSEEVAGRDRLVVRTLRCGRNNPGSNPGHGTRVNFIFSVHSRYSRLDLRPLSEEVAGRDRLVVRTLRCGRNNPGSNPGHGTRVNFIFSVHSRYSRLDLRPLSEEVAGRDRLVVRTLRCGRNNPGSNPGHGTRINFIVTVHSRYSLPDLRPLSEEVAGRDRLVVRTLRCGRNNPGSNPGHGTRVNFIVTVHSRYSLPDLRPLSEEVAGRDRLVVRTLRCGRNNPGSNPGHGTRVNFIVTVHSRYSLPDLRPLSEEVAGRDRLVVRTLRCGRNNPGSNPGHGIRVNFIVTVHSRHSLPDLRPLSEEVAGRDRLVVRTLRCGRNNPGSNPGHGTRVNFIVTVHSRYSLPDLRPLSEEVAGRDRLVVRTLRCGRNNPGSNPGHGTRVNFIFSVHSRYSRLDLRPLSEEVAGRDRLVVRILRCPRRTPLQDIGPHPRQGHEFQGRWHTQM
ncbi:hypothetical protein AAG570_005115 [Ranatra chinensis]|uniref:Reverse transcriptase domain-containing protein n=1 Tax=Ranatra chinensis TaxID=642074 RepID=A0ABD0YC95_9HEMI